MKKPKNELPLAEPPEGLSEHSQSLWRAVVDRTRSRGRQAILEQSLRALDRADVCRAAVDSQGLTLTTPRSGVAHLHPLLAMEERFRRQFVAGWTALNLQSDAGVGFSLPWSSDDE